MRRRKRKKMLKSFLVLEGFPREREEWLREHFLKATTFIRHWYGMYVHLRKMGQVMSVTLSPHSRADKVFPPTNKETT